MDLFSLYRSKKTSESGVWVPDEEAVNCACCGVAFSLLIRKHHCRCGQVVCGPCSENRTFLESSRTGALKRICDKCYAKERGGGDDDEDGGARPEVRVDGGSRGGDSSGPASGAASPAAAVAKPTGVSEESVKALKEYAFEGGWVLRLFFNMVDLMRGGDPVASGMAVGAFKGPSGKGGRKSMASEGPVKAGSILKVKVELETKGAAYFKGITDDFGQFGRDGKVNGALQRASGKVNMTVQVVHMKTTTSFNFVGTMNKAGVYSGTFSGCEISKSAGSVAGTFRMDRIEGGDEEEEEDSEDSDRGAKKRSSKRRDDDSDDGAAAKRSSRNLKKPSKKDDDESDEDEPASKPKKKSPPKSSRDSDDSEEDRPKKPTKKAAVKDDDDSEEERPKKPAKKAAAKDDDDSEEEKPRKPAKKPARKASTDTEDSD